MRICQKGHLRLFFFWLGSRPLLFHILCCMFEVAARRRCPAAPATESLRRDAQQLSIRCSATRRYSDAGKPCKPFKTSQLSVSGAFRKRHSHTGLKGIPRVQVAGQAPSKQTVGASTGLRCPESNCACCSPSVPLRRLPVRRRDSEDSRSCSWWTNFVYKLTSANANARRAVCGSSRLFCGSVQHVSLSHEEPGANI